jgi:hypothetical protein
VEGQLNVAWRLDVGMGLNVAWRLGVE